MTYQEIQDRLSKCESTLEQLRKGSVKPTEKITVKNLELLKESLQKQLVEADKGVVYTDDEQTAKDLADDGTNVKLTSEMKPGDEEDMERRRLSRLSTKDQHTLMAIKALMDKEKGTNEAPEGPSINKMSRAQCIDFLNTSPEKVNHMSDEELRDACKDKNADLRENVDTNEAIDPSITDLLVQFVSLMGMGYGAYAAAKKLSDKHGDIDLDSIKAALSKKEADDKVKDGADTDYAIRRKKESDYHQDKDYYKEEENIKEDLAVVGNTPDEEKKNAEALHNLATSLGLDSKIKTHEHEGEVSYTIDVDTRKEGGKKVRALQNKQFAEFDKNKSDDDESMYKPARLRKLTVGGKTYEKGGDDPNDDGKIISIEKYPNGYHITGGVYSDYGDGDDAKQGYGYAIDLEGNEMEEENLKGMYEGEKDDYGRNHYPEKGEYIKLSDEEREAMKNNKLGLAKEDTDVGHQDDEPSMLKSSAMETATYAAKLYKKLNRYDQQDGEVDFPNWWQKKLILARDYMSAAFHYLDSEEKQPVIDQLALENVNENEIGDADKDIGKGYKNARLVIAYIRDKFYRGMNDEELDEFNDEMIFHFKQEVDAIKSFKSPVNRGVTEEDDNPVPDVPVDDMQFMHDQIVNRMKELAKIYKEKGKDATVMLGVNNDKEYNVVDVLKKLTVKKRELEDALQNKVAGIGHDQELDEIAFEDIPCPACGDPNCDHKADHL